MSGINKYSRKLRKEIRRRNHIAHDLGSPKYRQRIKPLRKGSGKKNLKDWLDELDGD